MKKIKRFTSALLAMNLSMSILPMLPAHAEDSVIGDYIVIAVSSPENPGSYVISGTEYGETYYVSANQIRAYSDQEYFSYGDILEFDNMGFLSTAIAGTNHISIDEELSQGGTVTKAGSLFEDGQKQQFNVISTVDYGALVLSDGTKEYGINYDWYNLHYYQPDGVDYAFVNDFVSTNETVTCWVYNNRPVIALSDGIEDKIDTFIVVGADADVHPQTYILMDDRIGQTFRVDAETLKSLILDEHEPRYLDVLRFRNIKDSDIWEINFNVPPGTVGWSPEPMEDAAHTPGIINVDYAYAFRDGLDTFEVAGSISAGDARCIEVMKDKQAYTFSMDWVDDTFRRDPYILTGDEILASETVSCATYQGRPFLAFAEAYKDITDTYYIMGADDAENPQNYAVMLYGHAYLIARSELEPFMTETSLKAGDIIEARNISYDSDHGILTLEKYSVTPDGRPNVINVIGSLTETAQFEVIQKTSGSAKLSNTKTGSSYTLALPEGYEAPGTLNPLSLNQNDIVTCIINDMGEPVIVLSNAPSGDANGDNSLDILDVILVNKAIYGKAELSAETIALVDFNQNNIPDSTDALTMMKKIIGLM